MNDETFEKQDEFFRKRMDSIRPREVPREVLKGFRESVEKRILESGERPAFAGFPLPALALTVALLMLLGAGGMLALRLRQPAVSKEAPPAVQTVPQESAAGAPENRAVRRETPQPSAQGDSELLTDVEVLEALGAWTEDDEKSVGINVENRLQDLELFFDSDAPPMPGAV